MRHRVAHRKLGRVTEHRIALLRNQAEALLRHERIETTVPKARELRPFVERLITIAKRSLKETEGNGAAKAKANGAESPERAAKVRKLTARRLIEADLHNKAVVTKLFDTIAPRFEGRPGGYTRLLKIGNRRGDNAEVAQLELVGSEYNPALDKEEPEAEAPKPKGVRGRLAAAASRLRGEKKADDAEAAAEGGETKKPKTARKKAAPKKKTEE
jgi:large subunit ribosomal protein L17